MKAIFKMGLKVAKEDKPLQAEIRLLEITNKENFTVSVSINIFRNVHMGQFFKIWRVV